MDLIYSYINFENEKKEALYLLGKKEFEKLDALVGDCSCQIRAIRLLQLYKKMQSNTLNQEEQEFLALCKFLTQSKIVTYCEYNYQHVKATHNFKNIAQNCSGTKGRELIRSTQQRLSELSVQFIQKESTLFNNEELQRCLEYVVIDNPYFKREILAAYPVMKLILYRMHQSHIPLLIKMLKFCRCNKKTHELFFLYKSINGVFKLTKIKPSDLDVPTLVVTSFSHISTDTLSTSNTRCIYMEEFIESFKYVDCETAILAWFANHTQFIGHYRNQEIPYETLHLSDMKITLQKHRSLYTSHMHQIFSIYHIYADTLKNALKN